MNRCIFLRTIVSLLFAVSVVVTASAYKWDSVPADELDSIECQFDPDAAAEVMYKQIIYDLDDRKVRIIKTHLRTKIYDKSALDYARRIRFWYSTSFRPAAINARVIKPDGSFIEIEKGDIVSQVESKKDGRTIKSTTISIPHVEVGDMVEYRYRLVLKEGYYLPKDEVAFQEEWPIRNFHLKMKPYVYIGAGFKWASHRCQEPMKEGKGGFYEISLTNQPGYPDEPYQAPDSDAKSWFTFYNVRSLTDGDAFWKSEGKRLYKSMLSSTKEDKVVKAKANELAAGKAAGEETLKAFYDFCVTSLINSVHGKADRLTEKQRDELDSKWSASKILEKGFGTTRNINTVFCALARSAGFDARLSFCADRSDYSFTKVVEEIEIALPHSIVAIKNGDGWDFYNPASKYATFGQVDWMHDNVTALVPDKKTLLLVKTGAGLPEESKASMDGTFELSETGDLSGAITMTAVGNPSLLLKQLLDDKSETAREETIKNVLLEMWPNAQLDNIVSQNVNDPLEPLIIKYDLSIPSYAEAVGQRLFLQPNVEKRYAEAEFSSPTRKTMIFFDFKYSEESHIEIKLPAGYEFEAPSAPRPLNIEGFLTYTPKLSIKKKSNTIVYQRSLEFSGNQYNPGAYQVIKKSFDNLLTQDHHVLTLRKSEASVSASESDNSNG